MMMVKCLSLLLMGGLMGAVGAAPSVNKRSSDIPDVGGKVRGVNLGGWFLLEPWITPLIFDSAPGSVDEYTFCEALGKSACLDRLQQHWSSFYTAGDFAAIAAAGLNHVRIPIGYWAIEQLPGDPYVDGQIPYVDQAIEWARQNGLKVWIDLHGAPGGQNGFDNSGWRERIEWQQGGNVDHTLKVIRQLSQKYASSEYSDTVVAIELLNEPLGPRLDMGRIQQYWMDGFGIVRETSSSITVAIGDAFSPIESVNGFMTGWGNVVLDTHQYQVFTMGQLEADIDGHVGGACEIGRQLQRADKPTVTGEWSGAMTDCTRYLNGVGRGIRWEGTFNYDAPSWHLGQCEGRVSGSISGLGGDEMERTRRFVEAQLDAYEQGAGWFFWTWKTEQGSPGWEMRDLLETGVFPQPLTDRRYQNQCGF